MPKSCYHHSPNHIDSETEDIITLEESEEGTLCSIYRKEYTEVPNSRRLNIGSVRKKSGDDVSISHNRNRGCCESCKHKTRGVSPPPDSWSATFRSCSVEPIISKQSNVIDKSNKENEPRTPKKRLVHSYSCVNINKSNSCPCRTCTTCSKTFHEISSKSCAIHSRRHNTNVIASMETQNHTVAEHKKRSKSSKSNNKEMIHLKDELQRIKHQIKQVAGSKMDTMKIASSIKQNIEILKQDKQKLEKEVHSLLKENARLKKGLEERKQKDDSSKNEAQNTKNMLDAYETKLSELHSQVLKSSIMMNESKDKFCKCLKAKENKVKEISKVNEELKESIKEKESQYSELSIRYEVLERKLCENEEACANLSQNNQQFCDCISKLEQELKNSFSDAEQYKDETRKLEMDIVELRKLLNQKYEAKMKKLTDKYEEQLKKHEENELKLKEEISDLTNQVNELQNERNTMEEGSTNEIERLQMEVKILRDQLDEAVLKLEEKQEFVSKCKIVEENFQNHCELAMKREQFYQNEKNEMCKLIDELTDVIKQNKQTLTELSSINKEQEQLIKSQSAALISKDEQIEIATSEIEMMKKKSYELESQIQTLQKDLSDTQRSDDYNDLLEELETIKSALNEEKDNHLIKEKIIQDQSQTIANLNSQIAEKTNELHDIRDETTNFENELKRISKELKKKTKELDKEVAEKEVIQQKLQTLEFQKNQLVFEMHDLEKRVQSCTEISDNAKEQAIEYFKQEMETKEREWMIEREYLGHEKQKALDAAKFATQKLLETVADFQHQVDAQKEVQRMLACMLQQKEEQLRAVKSKMSSINAIATNGSIPEDINMEELYRRSDLLTNPTTTTSYYSSCSDRSNTAFLPLPKKGRFDERVQLFQMLGEDPKNRN